ncbi:hypothetical protein [Fusibacillus kribbianus]|uniref:Uncharacterized protein n=1 Tax=Fusibacillus kribbianus TaxID=3044208 RepID=A0AAP4F0F2_9FIRM|nr:hypothetical protein [Ruminococcus sp. YH-rum2234]MDI9243220.1 hypothetical protein [Ruminococcus sp. YH-rum2234]
MKRVIIILFSITYLFFVNCVYVFAVPDDLVDFSVTYDNTAVALYSSSTSGGSIVSSNQNIFYQIVGSNTEYTGGTLTFSAEFPITAVVAGFYGGATYSGTFNFRWLFTPSLKKYDNGTWENAGAITSVNIFYDGSDNVEIRPFQVTNSGYTGYIILNDKYMVDNAGIAQGLILPFRVVISGEVSYTSTSQLMSPAYRMYFTNDYFALTSGEAKAHWGMYDPLSMQDSEQHEEVINGYDNTAGNNANNSLESGLASYESEEAQAHNDFNNKMDSYTNPDTSDYVSGISFISSAVVLWWNGLVLMIS